MLGRTCRTPQKQKKKHIQRDFQETARNITNIAIREDAIKDFIHSELKIVNDRAGFSDVPGAHRGRDDSYGVFVTGNRWDANKGSITNTSFR